VHQNSADADSISRIENTSCAIAHECPTEAMALM
jgi:hypothetical protein